jgi:transcriptional regulator with XRE-family HTH domain
MNDPGKLLRQRRELHGLNQKQLAQLAKTSQGQISRIERGAISPSISTLERLLKAMGDQLELSAGPQPVVGPPIRTRKASRRSSTDPTSLLY